ncbi:MAG: glycosyltransferase [bacterium]
MNKTNINPKTMLISVVITSFNWPEALEQCLIALNEQTDTNFEVIVSDDGSNKETENMINKLKKNLGYTLTFLWQKHIRFHISKTRNKGIAKAKGDYIIFLDQDNICNEHFIANHRKHAQKNYFCLHQRIFINKDLTDLFLKKPFSLAKKKTLWVLKERIKGNLNKYLASINLPLGKLRYTQKTEWKKTASCFAIWKKDLLLVNGFNENYQDWGYEDSDLLVRLLAKNIFRKSAKYSCFVYHLHHKTSFRSEEEKNKNLPKLQATLAGNITPFPGLDQHLS